MSSSFSALERQRDIYLQGLSGQRSSIPTDPIALEQAAKSCMSEAAFAYVVGGAGVELTVQRNRNAFEQWHELFKHPKLALQSQISSYSPAANPEEYPLKVILDY